MTASPGFEPEGAGNGPERSRGARTGLVGPSPCSHPSRPQNGSHGVSGHATTLADLTRFAAKIADLERLERHHLQTLAAVGGSDEQIAEAAVHLHMARCLPGVGSSPAEVGQAVVEALRLCGRLPKTQDQQREEDR